MHKVRNDIYEAIEEIPDIVSRAQRYLEIYRDLQTFGLSQKVVQLFSAVLIALETIIKLLSERGISELVDIGHGIQLIIGHRESGQSFLQRRRLFPHCTTEDREDQEAKHRSPRGCRNCTHGAVTQDGSRVSDTQG